MSIQFSQELRSLEFAKQHYLDELIALLMYRDEYMITANKTRALSDIELMIKTMEELREVISK